MRISIPAVSVAMSMALAVGSLHAQTSGNTFFVSGNMDIYRAQGYDDGSDGVAPFSYTFPAARHQALTFLSIAGLWTCADGTANSAPWGPDGTLAAMGNHCYAFGTDIVDPVGTFSGYATTDFGGALVGVFLESALPQGAASSALLRQRRLTYGGKGKWSYNPQ